MGDSDRWYVVRTLRAKERLAQNHLRFQGFTGYLPMHQKTLRRAGRFQTSEGPLFPGYLFVNLDLGRDRWRSVNGTVGVAYLLMVGEKPVPVPRGLVEDLQSVFSGQGQSRPSPRFAPGDRVRLASGPFARMVGELQAIEGAGRVRILLEVMGRETPVWTKIGGILPAA